mmetsp:Transcript_6080/g.9322  ORF Transcript_6080/g.9322 Transcript_6080/m.9322 type:complete len:372 (+) Transcript_6080:161-1276(+)
MSSEQVSAPPAKRAKTGETLDEVLQRLSPNSEDGSRYFTATTSGVADINNFLSVVYQCDAEGTETPTKLAEKRCYFLTYSLVRKMVMSNPYGFEILTTHLIKAALAVSSVVAETSRPSIAEALKKIGFKHYERTTHVSVGEMFAKFENLKVVQHYFNEYAPRNKSSFETHLMRVEMEVLQVNGDQGGVKIGGSKVQGEHEVVMIDREMASRLKKLVHKSRESRESECFFYPPIACVNHGNSPFADGTVTIHARDASDATNAAFRISVSNQAKHSKGGMTITKLNAHADKCAKEVLDGLFGSERLLCVSTPKCEFSKSNKCRINRKFLRYELFGCKILKALMQELSTQRSKQGRIEHHAAFFNGRGQRVDLT